MMLEVDTSVSNLKTVLSKIIKLSLYAIVCKAITVYSFKSFVPLLSRILCNSRKKNNCNLICYVDLHSKRKNVLLFDFDALLQVGAEKSAVNSYA